MAARNLSDRPHFKIVCTTGMGYDTKILAVDGDTETDISRLVGSAYIDIAPGNLIRLTLQSPFVELNVIGYTPDERLRELVSLGKAARRMLDDPPDPT